MNSTIRNRYLVFFILCFSFFFLCSLGQSIGQELKQGYYPDGKIRYKGYFVDGKPVGEFIRYYQEGAVQAKMNYQGDTVKAILYSRNGEYTSTGKYVCQKKYGTWEYRKGQQLIARDEYRDDRLYGKSIRYGKGEVVIEQKNWVNGKADGEWNLYFPSGQLRMQSFYVEGSLNGLLKSYSQEGKLKTKGLYSGNLKEGEWEYYDDKGNVIRKQVYHGGISENAEEEELEESRELDALIQSDRKIVDPAAFADDPEAYMRVTGMD